jgi:CDP-4-dehydro-6-deoxyglucose reductase
LINQKSFQAVTGASILEVSEAAGLTLEHSCRNGRCGTCRVQVLKGRTVALISEESLTPQEKSEGWILSCARSAESDLHLAIEDVGTAGIPGKTLPCRIDSLELLASDVMKVVLRLPVANHPSSRFRYLGGQYVNVIAKNGQGRTYFIANSQAGCSEVNEVNEVKLELHIRRVTGGVVSTYWFEAARINDLLRLVGPLGTFFLRECSGRDVVFLATGTGINPIKAMTGDSDELLPAQRPRSVTLLWGGRCAGDLYWAPESVELIHTPVLSRLSIHDKAGWRGAEGPVQDMLLQEHNEHPHDWAHTQFYACGSTNMITSTRNHLTAVGSPAMHFYSDAFASSAAATLATDFGSSP